jgi:hypothetical protein
MGLPSSHQCDDFQPIALDQPMLGVLLVRHELEIHLDRNMPARHSQLIEQLGDGDPITDRL